MSRDSPLLEKLPPERLLDTQNTDVIVPAIPLMTERATVELYLRHERTNRNRAGLVRLLTERLSTLTYTTDETSGPGSSLDERSVDRDAKASYGTRTDLTGVSPPRELLALIHDHGTHSTTSTEPPTLAPQWDEL